ncbi:phosphoribosylanthranilate isomerase [Fluviicola sp.]|uniref:phosphoribosylanthranilate isomerase n=1 Tax=Fluviicola sp. TaxID=1917219 RepID=UPI002638BA90|nr:phosphoribosylanthranilate isomerase [Fluviicola sp.]
MKLKICGCSAEQFYPGLFDLDEVDYFGFIFYPGSPRYVEHTPGISKEKVGVFVNASSGFIHQKIKEEALNVIQFHGNESAKEIRKIKTNVTKWKALGIQNTSDFEACKVYEGIVDAFLFDTKSPHYGGTGKSFDWGILEEYTGETPFFLSGGISIGHADRIRKIQHPKLIGIDLNSRFEIAPKHKNVPLIETFIKQLKHENC